MEDSEATSTNPAQSIFCSPEQTSQKESCTLFFWVFSKPPMRSYENFIRISETQVTWCIILRVIIRMNDIADMSNFLSILIKKQIHEFDLSEIVMSRECVSSVSKSYSRIYVCQQENRRKAKVSKLWLLLYPNLYSKQTVWCVSSSPPFHLHYPTNITFSLSLPLFPPTTWSCL